MERFLKRSIPVLAILAAIALGTVLVTAYQAPRELTQGLAQKIFYVHVACVAPAYLGFLLAAIGGIGFLATHREVWDRFGLAGAEVGVLFCTLLIVTGPIWARPMWGVWWDWKDLRLASTAVLWFIYLGYLFLRSFADGDAMRRMAAVVGIAGTVAIPFVHFAVQLAGEGGVHPPRPDLSPEIAQARVISLLSFLVIFAYLFSLRFAVAGAEAEAEEHLERLEAAAEAEGYPGVAG